MAPTATVRSAGARADDNQNDLLVTGAFRSVLPHEPLPRNTRQDLQHALQESLAELALPHVVERIYIVHHDDNNDDNQQPPLPFSRARLQYASPQQALDVQTAWRTRKISPKDLFGKYCRRVETNDLKDGDLKDGDDQILFGSHPCLATLITTRPLEVSVSTTTTTMTMTTTTPTATDAGSAADSQSTMIWTRSNPPKFRRLLQDNSDAEERSRTRFVYVSGLVDSDAWSKETKGSHDDDDGDDDDGSSVFWFSKDSPHSVMQAIRQVFGSDIEVFLPQPPHSNGKKKRQKESMENLLPYQFCHIGMRSAEDAQRIVRDFQGVKVTWKFPGVDDDGSGNSNNDGSQTFRSGPLFLDYVTVTHKSKAKSKCQGEKGKTTLDWEGGEPSRPDCTTTTDHVHVPGLVLVEDYLTDSQETALMAVLTGPQAPWAPDQLNKSETGAIKRKVQHYGYVFDYRTADVLRDRRCGGQEEDGRANCPPLPSLAVNEHDNNDTASCDVEQKIYEAVDQGEGWEVLAGIIEKTRQHKFDVCTDCSNKTMAFDNLNQLTVNQYKPGEGIGSHVDTPSAFGDGLISISLNSGIVMEFRKTGTTPPIKKLVYLPRRSLLLMSGPSRFDWEHQIVTRRTDTHRGQVLPRGVRVSLTLRTALALDGSPMPRVVSSKFPPSFAMCNKCGGSSNALATPDVEKDHVHRLYDAIATQWHHTRGKRGVLWPGATQFLQNLQPGSIVADVGCGDGKYFPAIWEAGSYVIGTDISRPLLHTALMSSKERQGVPESRQVSEQNKALQDRPAMAVADCMSVPFRSDSCDAAICIAVMHHLSTLERRTRCIEELVRVVKPGGHINIQAWAMEQNDDSRRRFASTDVFVPFNAQPKYLDKPEKGSKSFSPTVSAPQNEGTPETSKGKSVAELYSEAYSNVEFDDKKGLVVFQRYCHLYRAGELEGIVQQVPGAKLIDSGYESGNHFVIVEVDEKKGK